MLLNLTQLYEPNNTNMDKTQPNQTKPSKPTQTSLSLIAKFSAISYPIELKFGMYAKWDLSYRLKCKKTKPNQTKPIQTKPNQTNLPLNYKFLANS